MEPWSTPHVVHYYETDRMDCVHHSNYIRWFEEARTDYMNHRGFCYAQMEQEGILCPVLEAQAQYRTMTHFGETVVIETTLVDYTGTRMRFRYTVRDQETGVIRCQGETAHCFLNQAGRPVSLGKAAPAYHQAICRAFAGE